MTQRFFKNPVLSKKKQPRRFITLLPAWVSCALAFVFLASLLPAASPYQGYNFFSSGSTAYLYDMTKVQKKTWKATTGSVQTSAYLLSDGSVLFPLSNSSCTFQPGGAHPAGRIQRISWDGALLWNFTYCDSTFTPSYDLCPLPNGNVLLIGGYQDSSKPGKIIEIQPTGTTTGTKVWECNVTNLLSGYSGYMNSVSYYPDTDRIVVSVNEAKVLAVIDHGAGTLLYKWTTGFSGKIHCGNWSSPYYTGTNILIPDADTTAMRIGNILVVSNGNKTVDEINPTTNTKVKTLSYSFSTDQGSAQRLPNGNTLVTKGYSTAIAELDDTGATVWSMTAPANIYRVLRYGCSYPGVSKLYSNPPVANFSYSQVGSTLQVQFTDTSTDDVAVTKWSWDFNKDNVADSTLQNPSYTFSAVGTYTVTLTVTDGDSQSNAIAKAVTVTGTTTTKDVFVASFTGGGLWTFNPNTSAWVRLNDLEPSLMAIGDVDGNGKDDIAGVFTIGLWIRYDSGIWSKVNVSGNPYTLALGDVDGNGSHEIVGAWTGIGDWAFNVTTNVWTKILDKDAIQISAGDYDLDGKDEILGWWTPEGLWIYDVATTAWSKVLDETYLVQIATGDMNGDKRADVAGIWTHGVWYYNIATAGWTKLYDTAEKIVTGDMNGLGTADLIGTWSVVPGIWVRYTEDGTWYKIHDTKPACFAAGKL